MRMRFSIGAVLLLALPALSACGDNDNGSPGQGKMSLGVTDAPVDRASSVVVQFQGVELKPRNGNALSFSFEAPRAIDLLALHGGDSTLLLNEVEVPAGEYEWLRLMVDAANDEQMDSYIVFEDGAQHELVVPSGAETGLKLVSGFRIAQGGVSAFTIDFDLRKSVHENRNPQDQDYFLRPALRIVDNSTIGNIAGSVDATLITSGCAPVVYVYEGHDVVPDDVDGAPSEPVTTALVEFMDTEYRYTAAFLAAGPYTAAFTCDADDDSPDTDDPIVFVGPQNATVEAEQTATVNFGP